MKRLLFFLFIPSFLFAQEFNPIDTSDYKKREKLIKVYEKIHEGEYKKIKNRFRGKLRKELTSIYERKYKEFIKNLKKKRFIFDSRFTNYTDSLTKVLIESNPNLTNKNIKVYISKNPMPNAMSIGDEILILNAGLFKYLENESQFLSVLSHELAHEKLNHVKKNIYQKAKLSTSKEQKINAKKIRRQRYNQYDKAFKLIKDLLYSDKKQKRKHEKEADSVGYRLYTNTKSPKASFINSLKLLAKYDTLPEIKLDSTIYKKLFDLPELPFKDSWMKMEEFSEYDYSKFKEKMDKDSLKTHPELAERIKNLEAIYPELKLSENKIEPNSKFKELQNIMRQEDVANLYYLEKYGISIRLILYKLNKNPDDDYAKLWLGKNFLALHDAKKKYRLNRYIDRVIPNKQSKNYQQFLNFIWNLNLKELETIGNYYATENDKKTD